MTRRRENKVTATTTRGSTNRDGTSSSTELALPAPTLCESITHGGTTLLQHVHEVENQHNLAVVCTVTAAHGEWHGEAMRRAHELTFARATREFRPARCSALLVNFVMMR